MKFTDLETGSHTSYPMYFRKREMSSFTWAFCLVSSWVLNEVSHGLSIVSLYPYNHCPQGSEAEKPSTGTFLLSSSYLLISNHNNSLQEYKTKVICVFFSIKSFKSVNVGRGFSYCWSQKQPQFKPLMSDDWWSYSCCHLNVLLRRPAAWIVVWNILFDFIFFSSHFWKVETYKKLKD